MMQSKFFQVVLVSACCLWCEPAIASRHINPSIVTAGLGSGENNRGFENNHGLASEVSSGGHGGRNTALITGTTVGLGVPTLLATGIAGLAKLGGGVAPSGSLLTDLANSARFGAARLIGGLIGTLTDTAGD